MRLKPVILSLALSSLALPAFAAVEVTYTNPEGFADVIRQNENLEVVASQTGDFTRAGGKRPGGPALRLLSLVKRNGLQSIV